MNKKFLSAVLFGALMVSSTGTFVSCKDYDDDIDNINKELSTLKGDLSALQAKVNEGKWITSLAPTTGGFTVTFSDNTSYTITNGKDGAAGADAVDPERRVVSSRESGCTGLPESRTGRFTGHDRRHL